MRYLTLSELADSSCTAYKAERRGGEQQETETDRKTKPVRLSNMNVFSMQHVALSSKVDQ